MRKIVSASLLASLLLLLAGCRIITIGQDFNPGKELTKTQKIVIAGADGTEKSVLETEDEIDAFAKAVNAEEWHLTELPDDLTEAGSFTLWQTETVTALAGDEKTEMREICTLLIYQDGDYLTIDTGFAGIAISSSIPEETATYLRGLVQE